ncbi:MAG: hypothetical protein M3Y24_01730 [Acidobacteriota bacterium]|nr:hypothetical protein [Acidobacteriota bacterium]
MTIKLTMGSRNVLEALCTLEQKWANVIHNSTDENEQAEYGNDLALLRLTRDRIRDQAVKAFGSSVAAFDRSLV